MIDLLRMLAGEWQGKGFGEYPTIASFEYLERLRYTLDEAPPSLHYLQNTRRFNNELGDYVPSHRETGYLRWLENDRVTVANAQFDGRVEVMKGTIEATAAGLVLRLRSTHFANDERMGAATRTITVAGDTLHYIMHMQTTKVPELTLHLEATLQRQ
ncbi:MAG: FABP family protein [Candidatus Promineifilaceae bacterium]